MQVLVNTDNHITNSEDFTNKVIKQIEDGFKKFESHLTRIEVHFHDENSSKSGPNDKKCSLEIRPEHHDPLAATNHASTLDLALSGAIHKGVRVVGDFLEKANSKRAAKIVLEPDEELN